MDLWRPIRTIQAMLWGGRLAKAKKLSPVDVANLKDAFESDPQAFINLTENPNEADILMIGTFVQLYCYADFSARRIVASLKSAATGKPREVSRLQDAQVFPALEKLANDHLPDSNLRKGLLSAAKTIEMHHSHRHNFAHWAVRRVKGADAFVMFSANAREAERRDGSPHGVGQAKFGILALGGFRDEIEKLKGHTNYLARTAAGVENNIISIRDDMLSHGIAKPLRKGSQWP